MNERRQMAEIFALASKGSLPLKLIAGDASHRKYYRCGFGAGSALVMDAPPDKGEDIRPVIDITQRLSAAHLSAPEIYAQDKELGFLLIEDFGDSLMARVLEQNPSQEQALYQLAIDVLTALPGVDATGLAPYDPDIMAELSALCVTWYRAGTNDESLKHQLETEMNARLGEMDWSQQVLVQRDYHAENLIYLPARTGPACLGLLDFQDAMLGHPAYDLVSILQDARRGVPLGLQENMLARYISAMGKDGVQFTHDYHLLGLQRNLRILGVFARLCLRDGKPNYLDLLPRVWGHIRHNLDRLEDSALSQLILENLPQPSLKLRQNLRNACPCQ
jgi:aminoglycoside/choline kinase family phosphotransferase